MDGNDSLKIIVPAAAFAVGVSLLLYFWPRQKIGQSDDKKASMFFATRFLVIVVVVVAVVFVFCHWF